MLSVRVEGDLDPTLLSLSLRKSSYLRVTLVGVCFSTHETYHFGESLNLLVHDESWDSQ